MAKDKIVFIQPSYAHYRKELFNKLNDNFDVLFIFVGEASPYPSSEVPDVKWHTMCLNSGTNRFWMFSLLRVLLTIEYDVIVSSLPGSLQSFMSFCMAKLLKKRLVTWNIRWNDNYEYSAKPQLYRALQSIKARYIVTHSDSIVVAGSASLKFHKQIGVPGHKIFIANQSVKGIGKHVKTTNLNDELGITDKFVILYLSRIIGWKGLDILIEAFKRLETHGNKVFLLVGGDGPHRSFCEKLSNKLGVSQIKFIGNIPNEKIDYYFSISNIFVLPSCTRGKTEAWGLVINEAMSAGKPIVTTDAVGAATDLVKSGINGYIVKNNDVEEMYVALKQILSGGKEMIDKMGEKSLEIFNNFNDYNKMYAGFEKAILFSLSNTKHT